MIKSIALALVVVASLSACGKKKSPASPANSAPESGATAPGGASDSDVKDESKPDDPDDAEKMGADPCDGGE